MKLGKAATCSLRRLSVIVVLATTMFAASREKVLYSFAGGNDGSAPFAGVAADRAGNLYGTTYFGGSSNCFLWGCGVVFELSPVSSGHWTEKVLYAFSGGMDGAHPKSNLILDSSGNLYGTTYNGGITSCGDTNGCGTVFELSPNSDGTWAETVLHAFQGGSDGAYPVGGLVLDQEGNLYGTNSDLAFELSPSHEGWVETVLHQFGYPDGEDPESNLIFDAAGNLYGTTRYGGNFSCVLGCGIVFELSPNSNGPWTETILKTFEGGGNGGWAEAPLVFDSQGNLYSTLTNFGNGFGLAFELLRVGNKWNETLRYNFCARNNCIDGQRPSGLVLDPQGDFYGTTNMGGQFRSGTVFQLTPRRFGWKETVIHSFGRGQGEGSSPYGGVIRDARGNLYGTTLQGGDAQCESQYGFGCGTVFEVDAD